MDILELFPTEQKNFVFLGESGSGKSEIAVNVAMRLAETRNGTVHFFDMDMTKPLFRSRDIYTQLEATGIEIHYEEQFMDAPTLVGGVSRMLKEQEGYVVMDVGGDYIGARAIGGFSMLLNQPQSGVYYIINTYRPWSGDMDHIDWVLGEILGSSHIQAEKLTIVSNPNIGNDTKLNEILIGHLKLDIMISEYKKVSFVCTKEELAAETAAKLPLPVLPIKLYLKYPWVGGESNG